MFIITNAIMSRKIQLTLMVFNYVSKVCPLNPPLNQDSAAAGHYRRYKNTYNQ